MRRSSPLQLVVLAVAAAAVAWLGELALVSGGRAAFVPPVTIALALIAIAIGVVLAALPVRRVARGRPGAKVDPTYATRVLVLAKAAAITGAILTGAVGGILAFLLTRPVVGVGSVWPAVLAAAASAATLAGGLIAENMCRIPPDQGADEEGDAASP